MSLRQNKLERSSQASLSMSVLVVKGLYLRGNLLENIWLGLKGMAWTNTLPYLTLTVEQNRLECLSVCVFSGKPSGQALWSGAPKCFVQIWVDSTNIMLGRYQPPITNTLAYSAQRKKFFLNTLILRSFFWTRTLLPGVFAIKPKEFVQNNFFCFNNNLFTMEQAWVRLNFWHILSY